MGNASGSPRRGFGPRPEARPFTWDHLTEDQRKVVQDIHDWLIAYVGLVPSREKGAAPALLGWSVDPERPSNVLLIDGGRGSGKTSVLLSLLDLWNRRIGSEPDTALPDWKPIEKHLGALSGRLVPVKALDLQPLPPSTSLRTWIAGRLLNLAESFPSRSDAAHKGRAASRASWTPSYEDEPAWSKAWRELLQDAAAGWHPAGGAERGRLDPETLAVELEQAELARLSIDDKWRAFVDAVVDAVGGSGSPIEPDARIIIPIDDADMNPTRCVELLDLLRTLWHPRLVFLLTGHSDLFLKTLTLHFLGIFRAQLGGYARSDLERSIIETQDPTPDDLALQSYDKVLPTHQRFTLSPLPPEERRRLLDAVLDVRIQRRDGGLPPAGLREYFDLNHYVLAALPDRLRKIQNLRQLQNQHAADERHAATVTYALWREALRDERYRLPTEDARNIEAMVSLEDGQRLRIQHMSLRFQRRASQTKHFQFQVGECLLQLTEATGFTLPLRLDERPPNPLPERLSAALLLAVDFFLEERGERFELLSPMPQGFDNALVKIELTHLLHRTGGVVGITPQLPAATWPLPDWQSPVEFAIFDRGWNHALRAGSGAPEARVGAMAAAFLEAVLAAHLRTPTLPVQDVANTPDWTAIAHRLVGATHQLMHQHERSEREEIFLRWLLGRAILLSAPESGLPADAANRLLTAWLGQLAGASPGVRERALQAARTERAEQAARLSRGMENASEFLTRLDARFHQHAWARKVEMQGGVGAKSLQERLRNELSSFSGHTSRRSLSKPRTLGDYMDTLQLHIPVTPSFVERARTALGSLRNADWNTLQALLWLWNNLVDESGAKEPALKELVVLDTHGERFHFSPPARINEHLEAHAHRQTRVVQAFPVDDHGTKLQLHALEPIEPLDELSQFLMLVHDVMADTNDPKPPTDLAHRFSRLPHAGTSILFEGREVPLGWPIPWWDTFVDWKLMEQMLTGAIEAAGTVLESYKNPGEYRRGLAACMTVALYLVGEFGKTRESTISFRFFDKSFDSWRNSGDYLRRILHSESANDRRTRDNRWDLVRDWALTAAPLYAAPELGLSPVFARGLLAGWMGTPNSLREEDPLPLLEDGARPRKLYQQFRRYWATRCLQESGLSGTEEEAHRLLLEVDRRNPGHPWHEVFGAEPDTLSVEGP